MRKILVIFAFLMCLGFLFVPVVKAEETGEIEPQITNEETNETPNETEPEETEVVPEETEENELTEDDIWDKITEKVKEYSDSELVLTILSWVRDSGVLAGLIAIVIKYSKYKNKTVGELTTDLYQQLEEKLGVNFKELSDETLQGLIKTVEDNDELIKKLMNAIILMQNSTDQGKINLLEYLNSDDTKESVKSVKEEINKQVEQKEEIKEEVSEYKDIF